MARWGRGGELRLKHKSSSSRGELMITVNPKNTVCLGIFPLFLFVLVNSQALNRKAEGDFYEVCHRHIGLHYHISDRPTKPLLFIMNGAGQTSSPGHHIQVRFRQTSSGLLAHELKVPNTKSQVRVTASKSL